jgi:hypothetical protein
VLRHSATCRNSSAEMSTNWPSTDIHLGCLQVSGLEPLRSNNASADCRPTSPSPQSHNRHPNLHNPIPPCHELLK